MRTCNIEGCEEKHEAKGYCKSHYWAYHNYGDPNINKKVYKIERVGELGINKWGSKMEIVKYNNAKDIWVKFIERGNLVHTQYRHFCSGGVGNPFDKRLFGVGFIGEGHYNPSFNGKDTIVYITWRNMLRRCYSDEYHEKYPTYRECTVCEEWHNFQNFAKWYEINYYLCDNEEMCLDKDISIKGNKIYSPDRCIFVPNRINGLFIKANKSRGNLPIGVTWHKGQRKYNAQLFKKHLGSFDNELEAFKTYKKGKENLIKEIAEKYREKIPKNLYIALINYKVEIHD